jgi:hypothetical protein
VNGLDCMITGMPQAYHAKPARAGGKQLVPCTQRMLASDIIYTDSYSTPAGDTLQRTASTSRCRRRCSSTSPTRRR